MDNNIEVLVSMQDTASAGIQSLNSNLMASKSAIRELAMGTAYLGSAFLGMSVAMKNSNNASLQGVGNMLAMVGGIMTAVGSAAHFISAITKMTSALQKLNIAQVIANALSGPGGWAKLAIGGAVAGAAVYGVTKLMSKSGGTAATNQTVINQHIAGSVVTQRELTDNIQRGLILKADRSGSTGIK